MVSKLTRRQELVLREYRAGHVTQKQLAKEWGITRSAVAGRLQRARKRLGQRPPERLPRLKIKVQSLETWV